MRRTVLCALLIALVVPATCLAAPPYRGASLPRPYLGAFAGVSVASDTTVSGRDFVTGTDFRDRTEFDPGINIGGTAGLDFNLLRLEGELSYKHAEFSRITESSGNRFFEVDGSVGALAVMFNAFLDLHNGSPVTPYFGGGIGFAAMNLDDTFGDGLLLYGSEDDAVFAYQAGAGIGIALAPQLVLDVGYRYFGTSEARFDSGDIISEFEMKSHNATVGIRVTF